MDKLTLLRALLEKETDAAKRKALEDEILQAIRDEAKAEAKKDAEAAVKKELDATSAELAKMRSQFGGMAAEVASDGRTAGSGIEVGTPGLYKGFKLKGEITNLSRQRADDPHARQRAIWLANPAEAERFVKAFIDMFDRSIKNPRALDAIFKAGMNEGTTTAGGFLVPDEFSDEWSFYVRDESVALQFARIVPMTSDVEYVNKENATVNSAGGVIITAEATAATEVNPTVAQTTLTAKRLDGYVRVSNEALADARVRGGLVNQLLDQFAEATGQVIDSAVFIGAGEPMSGVFKSAGYSQQFSAGSTNFSELLVADVLGIIGKTLFAGPNARWFIHQTVLYNYFYNLQDTTNRPIFIPSMATGPTGQIMGWPVTMVKKAPSTTAVSTGMAVFGDLRGVLIGERSRAMQFFVDPYTRGLSHETIFAMFNRYAFAQHLPNMYGRINTPAS